MPGHKVIITLSDFLCNSIVQCAEWLSIFLLANKFLCFFQIAKHFVNSNLKFAIANEEEFADEIKNLGFEDSGEDVNVGCFTEKQKFRMKPTEEFEVQDLVSRLIKFFNEN